MRQWSDESAGSSLDIVELMRSSVASAVGSNDSKAMGRDLGSYHAGTRLAAGDFSPERLDQLDPGVSVDNVLAAYSAGDALHAGAGSCGDRSVRLGSSCSSLRASKRRRANGGPCPADTSEIVPNEQALVKRDQLDPFVSYEAMHARLSGRTGLRISELLQWTIATREVMMGPCSPAAEALAAEVLRGIDFVTI